MENPKIDEIHGNEEINIDMEQVVGVSFMQ